MSKAKDDLKKILQEMSQGLPPATPKPEAAPVSGGMPAGSYAGWALIGIGIAAVLAGSFFLKPALVLAGLLVSAGGGALRILSRGKAASEPRSPDAAIEVLKRKSVEVQNKRLQSELEEVHVSLQKANDRLLAMEQDLAMEKANRAGELAGREQELRAAFESEKKQLLDLIRVKEEASEELEKQRAQQEVAWAHKFEEFERHLTEGSIKDLEKSYTESRTSLVQESQNRLEALKQEFVEKQRSLEASFGAERAGLKRELESLQRTFDAEREKGQKNLSEERAQYNANLTEQQERFDSQKAELLSVCQELLAGVEAREQELENKERGLVEEYKKKQTELQGMKENLQREISEEMKRYKAK